MRPAQLLRFRFPRRHKPELQTMPVVIWINIAALQVSYVWDRLEGHKTSERDRPFPEISQPPISLCKMALLQHRPFRNKLVEGVDRVGERDAIDFADLIGHRQNALGSRSRLEKRSAANETRSLKITSPIQADSATAQ